MLLRVGLFSIIISLGVSATTLYKVVGKDGTITYTDTPQPGAEKVDLSKVNSAVMPALAKPSTKPRLPATQDKGPAIELELISPQDQQTVRNNLGNVSVRVKLSAKSAGMYQLIMDGQVVQTSPNPAFNLTNVDRGEHKIQVHFIQNRGKILASTPLSTFYLQKASVLINPN